MAVYLKWKQKCNRLFEMRLLLHGWILSHWFDVWFSSYSSASSENSHATPGNVHPAAAAAVHSAADNIFHVGRVSDVRSVRQILRGQIPARDIGIPNVGNTNELLLERGKHVRPET